MLRSAASAQSMEQMVARVRAETGLPLDVVVSSTARRIIMKVGQRSGRLHVTVTPMTSPDKAEAFVRANLTWARVRTQAASERIRLLPGTQVCINGIVRTIRQDSSSRFAARLAEGPSGPEILVGRTEAPERHVETLLREEALRRMDPLTRTKAAIIGRKVSSITIKDTSSRWGSCSSGGCISYSWRMVLAPLEISDYLAAHETAHLAEMNHSYRFWAICNSLSAIPRARADAWLARNGSSLMRYGSPG